ncbi:Sugar diacid utilization regulator [uncultured Roseburia sp.]|uniref:Helix-turn-helix domain-containing protein n=1 Tax=Brotonthovivens ammoniilytica TaxID=2981725 RepID=A0ABT2THL6_9FIRM|nr:helix-turn-helix domain-containing protein [Brotonthovivens ammoniilytica]MCU6761693.1 helix-turn-helix domain-containing protein [Brotonthovivens ammoniilytica]SCI43711.1 Sugar diacid utilization regulator [uncultured Roseburia sp.]
MQLPLNVLLYRLSPNSRYDIQNTDLSCRFDGIQLFDANETPIENQNFLYLVSEKMLRGYANKFLLEQLMSKCVFLCISSDDDTTILNLNHNLSVILLHTKDSFPLIFNKILNIFREFDEWDKSFHLTLLQGGSLQELLNISSSILVHPMIVFDRNYTILGYLRSPDVSDPFMEQMIKTGYATPEDIRKLREDGLISASEHSANPLINWYCLPDQNCYYSMMYRFKANQHIVGYALIFCCTRHPNTNYLDLMDTVCENLELYFHQDRFTSRSSSEIYEPILTEILEHPELPAKQLQDQIRHIPDLNLNGNFVLSKLAYSEIHKLPFSFVSWNLRTSIPSLKPFVYQNFLYILRDNSRQEDCTCFLTDKEQKIFDEIFSGHLLTCGISQTFFSLADLPLAAAQCREAVLLGSRLFTDSRKFFKFEDIAIFYFLREMKKHMPLPMIASPYYHLLKQYDADHNSDLCEIFYTFLLNGRNINQTSAAIFMHRNTVLNKIKKASAIMNNDFNDYQTQLYYIISYLSDRSPLLN